MKYFRFIVWQLGTMEIKNKKIRPAVSVIIPTHNRLNLLKIALNSVLEQTIDNIEIVIINDASCDGTKEFLKNLSYEKVRYINNESPLGGGAARNLGIKLATGKFIAFLDDDDTWMPDKLQKQLEYFNADSELVLVSCAYYSISENGTKRIVRLKKLDNPTDIYRANFLGGASMYLVSRDSLVKYGYFDPSLRSGQDWDLLILLSQNGKIGIINKPLVNYLEQDHVRISNNIFNTYAGLRNIYFKYKQNMPIQIANSHLCTLAFLRFGMRKKRFFSGYMLLVRFSCILNIKEQCKFLLKILVLFFFKDYILSSRKKFTINSKLK